MLKKWLAVMVISLLYAEASAANWQQVSNGAKLVAWVDVDSLTTVGSNKKAWFRIVYAKSRFESDGKEYNEEKGLWYFNCLEKKLTLVSNVSFKDGELVKSMSVKFSPNDLADVVPESIGEQLLTSACSTKWK